MPPLGERPPIPDERRLAVSQWIEHAVRPVAHAMTEETMDGQVADHPFEVRDHQVEGWDALWQSRIEGAARALIHLATGGGKTTLAAVDLMKYREECAQMNPPVQPRALYVSHKREINDQAAATIREFMPDLEEHFFDTRKVQNRPEADITYAPIQSLYSKLHTFDPEEFEYIIWDEAHHLEAETYKKVLEYFRPLFEYALTATPDRADGKDIRDYFGEAILSKGVPEGIAEGWLADVDYHIVFDKAIKEEVKAGFHPKTLKEIKDLFEKKASPEALAESIREEIEKLGLEDPKTMIFCESIEEADEMARLLGGVAYHSDTPDRPQVLKDFKSGKIRVVTSKDMFNEGVNVPDAEVVIFLRATDSDAVFKQQLGRGLRKITGKDKVYVLDFVANIERIAKVRELSEAIQQHARELGDPELSEQHMTGDAESGGRLRIHSRHGDFDFDTIAVDLLAKFDALKRPDAPVAAEEYYSINSAYKAFGIGPKVLEKLIDEMGWELPLRKFGPQTVRAISLQQIEQLRTTNPDAFATPLPDGYLSVKGVAAELGVDFYTVKRIIDESGWALPRHKFKGGVVSVALSPAQVTEIRKHPNVTASSQEEGAISITALAQELGMASPTLKNLASKQGMAIGNYRFGKGKTRGEGFTSNQATSLREIVASRGKESDLMRTKDAAHDLGVHYQTVVKLINELGLTLQERKGGNGRMYPSLSRQQVEFIRASERYKEIIERAHRSQQAKRNRRTD